MPLWELVGPESILWGFWAFNSDVYKSDDNLRFGIIYFYDYYSLMILFSFLKL